MHLSICQFANCCFLVILCWACQCCSGEQRGPIDLSAESVHDELSELGYSHVESLIKISNIDDQTIYGAALYVDASPDRGMHDLFLARTSADLPGHLERLTDSSGVSSYAFFGSNEKLSLIICCSYDILNYSAYAFLFTIDEKGGVVKENLYGMSGDYHRLRDLHVEMIDGEYRIYKCIFDFEARKLDKMGELKFVFTN